MNWRFKSHKNKVDSNNWRKNSWEFRSKKNEKKRTKIRTLRYTKWKKNRTPVKKIRKNSFKTRTVNFKKRLDKDKMSVISKLDQLIDETFS